MLTAAGVAVEAIAPNVDEDALKVGLKSEGVTARNLADALAEAKAVRLSRRIGAGMVLGADQMLALEDGALRGAALFSPVFSTVRGAAGVYVSDLWVADAARGLGLGRRLLGAVGVRAGRLWRARWLTLAVYDHSTASRRFYDRLGFEPQTDATVMKLGAEGFAELMRNAG